MIVVVYSLCMLIDPSHHHESMVAIEDTVNNKLDYAEVNFLGDFSNTIRIMDKIIFTVCKTFICMLNM